jgi:hypothetical protein
MVVFAQTASARTEAPGPPEPPSARRLAVWQRLRQAKRSPVQTSACHSVQRFLAARDSGERRLTPHIEGTVSEKGRLVPFRSRVASSFLTYVGVACLERRHPALIGKLDDVAELLHCSKRSVQDMLSELAGTEWSADRSYEPGDLVIHRRKTWQAQAHLLIGAEPGQDPRWKEAQAWIVRSWRFEYAPGFIGRDGKTYQHRQLTTAYQPGPLLIAAWQAWRTDIDRARRERTQGQAQRERAQQAQPPRYSQRQALRDVLAQVHRATPTPEAAIREAVQLLSGCAGPEIEMARELLQAAMQDTGDRITLVAEAIRWLETAPDRNTALLQALGVLDRAQGP